MEENENVLQFDLNEIVSKSIADKIDSYEKRIKELGDALYKANNSLKDSRKLVEKSRNIIDLIDYLKEGFSKIKKTPKDKDGYGGKSTEQNQYNFIEKILLNIFNIKPEYNGWTYIHCGSGNLKTQLAINYYSNKRVLIDLLKVLLPENDNLFFGGNNIISFIESFKMPFNYPKQDVLEYVKQPKYNTNGAMFGISSFWIEQNAGKANMPHDLIMLNDFILEKDVFNELIKTLKAKRGEFHYLFALPKYNSKLTKEQIIELGECLIGIDKGYFVYEHIKEFIKNNLKTFNKITLDFLYDKAESSNEYKVLFWENFPNEYQMKFLMSKSLDEILKLFTAYNCSWTIEEKEQFLKQYINK